MPSPPCLYLYRKRPIFLSLASSALEDTIGMSYIMVFLVSLVLLVLIVRDPSVFSGSCSEITLLGGLPTVVIVEGGIMLFCLVFPEVEVLASVDDRLQFYQDMRTQGKDLIIINEHMQSETRTPTYAPPDWLSILFFCFATFHISHYKLFCVTIKNILEINHNTQLLYTTIIPHGNNTCLSKHWTCTYSVLFSEETVLY